MELFDEENKIEPYRAGIFVSTEVPISWRGGRGMKEVERRVKATLRAGKVPCCSAGSIPERWGRWPAAQAVRRLDRAAIRRTHGPSDTYLGTPHNHACVGRRIVDAGRVSSRSASGACPRRRTASSRSRRR